LAITQKAGQFRGESRFTTWACKFVVFEVSAKIGRHFWRHPTRSFDARRKLRAALVANGYLHDEQSRCS
jgi:hypothetical protein